MACSHTEALRDLRRLPMYLECRTYYVLVNIIAKALTKVNTHAQA